MNAALLLLDLQGDFLDLPGLQPPREQLISQAVGLLEMCRQKKIPVIHLWTTIHRDHDRRLPHWKKNGQWHCVDGTPGHRPPRQLQPAENEVIVHKSGFNGFAGGELDAELNRLNCDTVVLVGIHLHTCVRTAAAESLERGLQVIVGEGAVATNDPVYAAGTRRWLAARGVEFVPASQIAGRLAGMHPLNVWHRSPHATERILFEVPLATEPGIAAATVAANETFKSWRQTDLPSRCARLAKLAVRLETVAPELARQMATEIGKPVSQGLEEVRRAAGNVRDVIQRATRFEFLQTESAGMVRHQPLGVIALISPWNNPVAIAVGKIAPALAYGNTVVWKPAPAATRISEVILKLLEESGVPADAVRLLTGDHTTAQRLAGDDQVSAVTFTGSGAAGFAIQEICARRFLPLQAELSGNNAAIVWDDANLPDAAAKIVWGAFGFAGQRCTANRRVIVSAASFERLWHEMKAAALKLNWGDPLEEATDIGPVIHVGKRDEQIALIAAAQTSGAAWRVEYPFELRAQEPWVSAGAYVQPALVACDQSAHPLVQEETMSPLLVVQRAKDFQHAMELSNGVRHGLAAALFSQSAELKSKFLAEARAGILKINQATAGVDASLPFGGWKMSGLGPPEHGWGDPLFYTRMQALYGTGSE
jgi:acyl-CoA reductase-like NAD-dependent aldehyde dehydrogenase/nicotinamidase-related amidase